VRYPVIRMGFANLDDVKYQRQRIRLQACDGWRNREASGHWPEPPCENGDSIGIAVAERAGVSMDEGDGGMESQMERSCVPAPTVWREKAALWTETKPINRWCKPPVDLSAGT
jgi:hypothetical protein